LGVIAEARGDHDKALQRYHKALEIARQIGHRDGEIVILTNLGGEKVAVKNYSAAESDLHEAIRLAGAAGSYVLSLTFAYLAEACLGQNKSGEALAAAQQALALGREAEMPEDIGVAWRALGLICEKTGQPVTVKDHETDRSVSYEAEECFDRSAKVLLEAGVEGQRAHTLREWAKYEMNRGNREKGMAMWQEARNTFVKLDALREVERMDNTEM
jgi:tetratricopeptide (TPR) repeat protein